MWLIELENGDWRWWPIRNRWKDPVSSIKWPLIALVLQILDLVWSVIFDDIRYTFTITLWLRKENICHIQIQFLSPKY